MVIVIYVAAVLIVFFILRILWGMLKKFLIENKGLVIAAIVLFILLMILI